MEELLAELRRLIDERVKAIEEEHSSPVIELDEKSFEELTKQDKLVVVLYTAPWCQPCKAFEPLYHLVASRLAHDPRYKDRVVMAKLDTEKYPDIADRENIDRIPSIVFYRKGSPVDVIIGAVTEEELVRRIDQLVSRA